MAVWRRKGKPGGSSYSVCVSVCAFGCSTSDYPPVPEKPYSVCVWREAESHLLLEKQRGQGLLSLSHYQLARGNMTHEQPVNIPIQDDSKIQGQVKTYSKRRQRGWKTVPAALGAKGQRQQWGLPARIFLWFDLG